MEETRYTRDNISEDCDDLEQVPYIGHQVEVYGASTEGETIDGPGTCGGQGELGTQLEPADTEAPLDTDGVTHARPSTTG